jgi:hypothetical protein
MLDSEKRPGELTEDSTGSTFDPIRLEIQQVNSSNYDDFVKSLRRSVEEIKNKRDKYYWNLRNEYNWVNRARQWMVLLGSGGIVLTAAAAAIRIFGATSDATSPILLGLPFNKWDIPLLVSALLLYGLMAACAFYERTSEGAGGYFRSILAGIGIRDQWTAYQFQDASLMLEPVPSAGSSEDREMRKRWLDAAEKFAKGIDAITAKELTEWRDAYTAAMKALSDAASEGLRTSHKALDEAVREAKEAAEVARNASKPATLNVTITAPKPGEATISIDGRRVASGTGRSFAITNLSQGEHVIRVDVADAGGILTAEQAVNLSPGIKDLTFTPK